MRFPFALKNPYICYRALDSSWPSFKHYLEIAKIMSISIGRLSPLFLTLVYFLVLFGAGGGLHAQDRPSQTPEQLTVKLTPQQIIELNEIAALRARMGDGVAQRLQGAVPGSDPNQQFHDSLKGIVSERGSAAKKLAPVNLPPISSSTLSAITQTSSATIDSQSAKLVLWSSAKKLEELAAAMERAKLYDKADELRKTAGEYWLQARSLD